MSSNALGLLVPTKLAPPQPLGTWVWRGRLLARLRAPLAERLTLVVAPAGFGKTTLVAQWLAEGTQAALPASELHPSSFIPHPSAVAWLTLDEYDQDDLRFLAYVAGAVERAAPGSVGATLGLLRAPEPPPPYMVVQSLLVELSALPSGLILVLDDYYLIGAQAVHQQVTYLLRNLPPRCRLVIVTRADPPLPLARLRAEGQLRELRAADLRFTAEEAGALLACLIGAEPDAGLVTALHRQTEGWVIALQLAAIAHHEASSGRRPGYPASRQIAEYLAEEVLAQQPTPVQEALLAFAVPERFCAGLCAALLGTPDALVQADSLLDGLTRANLLLVPLEGVGGWYRFHPMFRDLLLRQLRLTAGPASVVAIQLRAARWLEGAGLPEEALRLYLAAGDDDSAGALVERLLFRELGRDVAGGPPQSWLRLLPAALRARRPGLALIEARVAVVQMDVVASAASIAQVDALLAAPEAAGRPLPWPTFLGDLETLRGTLHYWQSCPAAAITALTAGLERGAVQALATSGLLFLGRAYVAAGRYEEGVRLIEGLIDAPGGAGIQASAGMRHTALCMMHELAGRVDDFYREALRLGDTLAAGKVRGSWSTFAASYIGRAAYERSDLGVAAGHFAEVRARKYHTNAYNYIGCLIGLAMIALAQGSPEAAAAYEEEALAFAAELGAPFLRNEALGCAVHLALARGDLAAALALAEQIAPDAQLGTRAWYAIAPPQLSKARALIAAGGAGLARAEAEIETLLAQVEAMHNARPIVCALATRATLRLAQGRPDEALATIERVLALAAPLGLVRTLVDCGPPLVPLLRAAAARGVAVAYVGGLLERFDAAPPAQARPAIAPPSLVLPEVLTRREVEILALLAGRWSDKEIAERLAIAPNTVRKHTSSIYGKLGVSSRREAVEAARGLGLLPRAGEA